MTTASQVEPLFTADTTLELSHWKSTWCPLNGGPHTAVLNRMGSNSFAMMFAFS